MTRLIKQYRTIWLSDVHLGMRGCKAASLLDFLRQYESEYLYLVGDIIDGWRLQSTRFWPDSHQAVLDMLIQKASSGTRVIYLPGNHDEFLRDVITAQSTGSNTAQAIQDDFLRRLTKSFTSDVGNLLNLTDEVVHVTADNRRLLVIHGDQFDDVVSHSQWLAHLGDWAYEQIIMFNEYLNKGLCRLGLPRWRLSAWLKQTTKSTVNRAFEGTLTEEARRRKLDGVVCGHIHKAQVHQNGNVLYCNDGDWVESCSALIEDWDGRLFLTSHDLNSDTFMCEKRMVS